MNEETKFDFDDPKSMMSPFEQMTVVMGKVFINRYLNLVKSFLFM